MRRDVRVAVQGPPSFRGLSDLPPPLQVVAMTGTADETVATARRAKADVILCVTGPDRPVSGSEIMFLVRQLGLPMVCLLMDGSSRRMREALMAGAAQALIWPDEADHLPAVLLDAAGSGVVAVPREPTVAIAVCGAKGGVGVTRIATELALACRQLGHPTLLADAGGGESGPLALLGLPVDRSLGELIGVADELTLDQLQKVAHSHTSGTLVAASGTTDWSADTLRAMVTACRRQFAVSVWDVPAGARHLIAQVEPAFTHVFCVTTPDAHAIWPLKRRTLPAWASSPILSRLHLVINRRTPDSLLRGPDVAAQLCLPLGADIEELPGLAAASGTAATAISYGTRRQQSRTARQIEQLARFVCPPGSGQ